MKPNRYYQIVSPDSHGILRPFEVNQFGETGFFETYEQAEQFIEEHFKDAQDVGSVPVIDKTEIVLSIIPVYLCRFK